MKRTLLSSIALLSLLSLTAFGEDRSPTPARAPAPVESDAQPSVDTDALFETGKQLFDTYASDEVKAEYEFPDKAQWDTFVRKLQTALESSSMDGLASMEPDARQALAGLKAIPEYADYAAWLDERIDLMQAAEEAQKQASLTPTRPPSPGLPSPTPAPGAAKAPVPYFDVWLARLKDRPKPAGAEGLMPRLKEIFAAEGIPGSLAWLAEVESSFNSDARSPAGAKGLFQLMPVTAHSMGLSTFPFDERTHPEKSARAAARMLHDLHNRFGSWPLALAAYNAGPTRVGNMLKGRGPGTDFADIASRLPSETRMYVPKVLATVKVRDGVDLSHTEKAPRVSVAL